MLDFIKEVRTLLLLDGALISYVGNRIYLSDKPIATTVVDYPQITMRIDDGNSDAQFGVCYPTFYIDIWTRQYGGWTQASEIGKRVVELLNGLSLTSGELEIYRMQKNANTITYDDAAMLWHRTITLMVVMEDYTEPQG